MVFYTSDRKEGKNSVLKSVTLKMYLKNCYELLYAVIDLTMCLSRGNIFFTFLRKGNIL